MIRISFLYVHKMYYLIVVLKNHTVLPFLDLLLIKPNQMPYKMNFIRSRDKQNVFWPHPYLI